MGRSVSYPEELRDHVPAPLPSHSSSGKELYTSDTLPPLERASDRFISIEGYP